MRLIQEAEEVVRMDQVQKSDKGQGKERMVEDLGEVEEVEQVSTKADEGKGKDKAAEAGNEPSSEGV